MIRFHSDYLHVEYYATDGVLISQWYGKCSSQQYREAMLLSADTIRQHHLPYCIADRRQLPQLPEQDEVWTNTTFLDLFRQLPLQRFAIINSYNEAAVQQMQHFLHHESRQIPFETRAFDDLTSAYDWLVAVKAA